MTLTTLVADLAVQLVVGAAVAGDAASAHPQLQPVVVEGGRGPCFLGMALTALLVDLAVQRVCGAAVASDAALAQFGLDEVVAKGCGGPCLLGMALTAVAGDLAVQVVRGAAVTVPAALRHPDLQQVVGEARDGVEGLHTLVVAMAGYAILFDQALMEGDQFILVADGHSLGRDEPNLLRFVALDTTLGPAAEERRMAGEAVGLQGAVGLHDSAGLDHVLG